MKDIKSIWKKPANEKANTARNTLEYALLRAIKAKNPNKRLVASLLVLKSFQPIKNKIKLTNGRYPYDLIDRLMYSIKWSIGKKNSVVTFNENQTILNHHWSEIFDSQEELDQYFDLINTINGEYLRRRYVYIFVDKNLSYEQQVVQAAHVTMVLGYKLKDEEKVDNLYFTVCGADSILEIIRKVWSMGYKYVEFKEPDIGNRTTAIALYPINWQDRGALMNFELLRMPRDGNIIPLTQADLG